MCSRGPIFEKITEPEKRQVGKAVKKVIREYGETLRLLENSDMRNPKLPVAVDILVEKKGKILLGRRNGGELFECYLKKGKRFIER